MLSRSQGTAQVQNWESQEKWKTSHARTFEEKLVEVAKGLAPPYLADLVRWLRHRERDTRLFGGDTALFEEHLARAQVYGEYGCGLSTVWVARNTTIPIYSVDTSSYWIDQVRADLGHRPDLHVAHVDLGPLGDWGRPVSYKCRDAIRKYTEGFWHGEVKPDVILVDGRFRVACFLASLLNAKPGSTILFDDYTDRYHYHVVEDFVPSTGRCGRQAAFRVPEKLRRDAIRDEYEKFLYVME